MSYLSKLATIVTFTFLLFNAGESLAQTTNIYYQDSLIRVLVKRHIALSQARKSMPGYRIQIFFGAKRTDALKVKSEFKRMYKSTSAYLIYQQPNFKIRVGDFGTRLEALKFLHDIQILYSASFMVKDAVKLPKL